MGEPPFRPAPGEVEGARQVQEEGGEERELQAVRSPSADGRHGDEGGVLEGVEGEAEEQVAREPTPRRYQDSAQKGEEEGLPPAPPREAKSDPGEEVEPGSQGERPLREAR